MTENWALGAHHPYAGVIRIRFEGSPRRFKTSSASQPLAGAPLVGTDLGARGQHRQPEQAFTTKPDAFRQFAILRYCSAYVIPADALRNVMELGFFTMPMHPVGKDWRVSLREDREAFLLAGELGFVEGYVGEHATDLAENITSCTMFIASLSGRPRAPTPSKASTGTSRPRGRSWPISASASCRGRCKSRTRQ